MGRSSGSEEDNETPNSVRRFVHGSRSGGDSPVHSSEEAKEEESRSLGRRNVFSEGEDGRENSEFDEFQLPIQNPNFSPNLVQSLKKAGEEESSAHTYIRSSGEEEDDEEISNFYGFQFSREISSHSEQEEGSSFRKRRRFEEYEDLYRPRRSPSPKRRKSGSARLKSSSVDRISSLPDCILLHIVSFLPANAGIQTGVLSKRWMDLWRDSPNLVFHYDGVQSKFSSFASSVDSTLILYSSPKIKKFHLHTSCPPFSRSQKLKSRKKSPVHSFLLFAIGHNVEDLSLKFCHPKFENIDSISYLNRTDYVMPPYLFDCSSLTKLSSRYCIYEPLRQVSWRLLRKLSISNSFLSNDVLQKILLGSPLLECLKLKRVRIDKVDVSSDSRLERLVVESVWNSIGEKVEILVPNVKSLEILGYWKHSKFQVLNASSLVNARIDFFETNDLDDAKNESEFVDLVRELFQQINHAKQLTVGYLCIQVLSFLEHKTLPSPLVNCNRKCLTLNLSGCGLDDFELPGIASLLYNSPTLEKLVIDFGPGYCSFNDDCCLGEVPVSKSHNKLGDEVWKSQERSYSCLLKHLKTIEFVGLESSPSNGSADTIVPFLLRHASVLEMVVLYPARDSHPDPRAWLQWARKLLSIQKANPRALIFLPDQFKE